MGAAAPARDAGAVDSAHQAFYPTLAAITERLRRRWEAAARDARVVDMIEDLKCFTVDVTSALAFGEDPNTLENERVLIHEQLGMLLPTLMARLTRRSRTGIT